MELEPLFAQVGECRQLFSERFGKDSKPYTSSVSQDIHSTHSHPDLSSTPALPVHVGDPAYTQQFCDYLSLFQEGEQSGSGYSRLSTDLIGTRFSTHRKRTLISARRERRRLHATERSPSRCVSSTLRTMARRRLWKRTKCQRFCCRLDLSDMLDTGPSERCTEGPRFLLSQTWCRRQRAGAAFEALEYSTAEPAPGVQGAADSDTGPASVPKGIEDTATTKGRTDVQ